MINDMKATIYATNKNVIRDLIRKSYYTAVNNVFLEATRIETRLNEKLTFQLTGGSGSAFDDSDFKGCDIHIRQFTFKGKDDFRFTPANGYTVTCTRYAWMLTGRGGIYPKYVDVSGGKRSDSGTFEFEFTAPKTMITVKTVSLYGKWVYLWSGMLMYNFEEGDGKQRNIYFILNKGGGGVFKDSGEGETGLKWSVDKDGNITIEKKAIIFTKTLKGRLEGDRLHLYDGDPSDQFTVEYMFVRAEEENK